MEPPVPEERRVNRPENEEVATWLFLKHCSMAEEQQTGRPPGAPGPRALLNGELHLSNALGLHNFCVCNLRFQLHSIVWGVEDWVVCDLKDSLPGSMLIDLLEQSFLSGSILLDSPEESPPTFVSVAPSDLHQNLGDLLKTGKGGDVVFEVGGRTFAAHRCVLAARSPVFSAELFGAMKEGNTAGVVRIDEMEAEVFKALLCFVYTDSLPATEEEEEEEDEDAMCQHLLVAADRYGMERLKSICEEKLCKFIDAATIATILTLAEQHHCDGLKEACLCFLGSPENLRALLDSEGFDHLSSSCPSVAKNLVAMSASL